MFWRFGSLDARRPSPRPSDVERTSARPVQGIDRLGEGRRVGAHERRLRYSTIREGIFVPISGSCARVSQHFGIGWNSWSDAFDRFEARAPAPSRPDPPGRTRSPVCQQPRQCCRGESVERAPQALLILVDLPGAGLRCVRAIDCAGVTEFGRPARRCAPVPATPRRRHPAFEEVDGPIARSCGSMTCRAGAPIGVLRRVLFASRLPAGQCRTSAAPCRCRSGL